MRAAVLRTYGKAPTIDEIDRPAVGREEALVRVGAAGICATDLKVISGALAPRTSLPHVLGHEVAGTVASAPFAPELEGRRVACHLYDTCGRCRWCVEGRETLCRRAVRVGIERDGGLAEYVAVRASTLIPFSEHTPFSAAAVAMDAVTTPWGALRGKAGVTAGDVVAVIGCGGIGSNAVQIALGVGARTAVVDPVPSHRELGRRLGAELAVGPDESESILELNSDGADVVLETSGQAAGFELAVRVVRPGGRIVCNGYQPGVDYCLDSSRLVLDEVEVIGSRVASRAEAARALAAVERGEVTPQVMEVMPLERTGEALDLLARGRVEGRLVIDPTR
jgi:D-arabinose 1-dehydrogenase-like Zn-dependent alcohol dehydrogenase